MVPVLISSYVPVALICVRYRGSVNKWLEINPSSMYLLFKKKMVWPSKPIFHPFSTVHCNYVARKSKEKIESSIYSVCLRHKFANSLEKKSTKTLVCLNILFVYIGSQTICMQFTQSKRLIHCMYYLLTRLTWLIHTSFYPQNGICA